MIERMNDVIVWDGFPHPDPVIRHASVTVQLAPPLWRRVLHHLTQQNGVQDAAQWAGWASWLGDEAALVALRDALERELAHDAPRGENPTLSLPGEAMEAIRATLRASFWQPLAIWFGSGDSKSDGYYRLILTNGAIAILRPLPADPASLLLEDLFFTQCKTKLEGDGARRLSAVSQATDRYATFLPAHRGDSKHHGTNRRMPRPHGIRFVDPRIWNDLPAAAPLPADSNPTPSDSAEKVGLNRLLDSAARGSNCLPSLSNEIATSASRELQNELETWTRSTAELPHVLDHSTEAYREERCLALLENRISAWARFIAIDEAYGVAMEAGEVDADFASEMDALLAAMESFDEALQSAESVWARVAARVELLNNWKNRLAAPRRRTLPWWLSAIAQPSGARARASSYLLG